MLDSRYISTYGASYRPKLQWPQQCISSENEDLTQEIVMPRFSLHDWKHCGAVDKRNTNGNSVNLLKDEFRKVPNNGFSMEPYPPKENRAERREIPANSRRRALKIAKSENQDNQRNVNDKNMSTNAAFLSDKLVFNIKSCPMDMKTMNALEHKYRYTSSAKRAMQEYNLPMIRPTPEKYKPYTTLDPKPDMVRLKGQIYEDEVSEWQDAVLFDRLQSRYLISQQTCPKPPEKPKLKQKPLRPELDEDRKARIRELVKRNAIANVYDRQIPGYAGYVPMVAPEMDPEIKPPPRDMISLVHDCYRYLPESKHVPYEKARTGVMSRLVTLTYPYNPFNKVEKEDIMETLGKKNISMY